MLNKNDVKGVGVNNGGRFTDWWAQFVQKHPKLILLLTLLAVLATMPGLKLIKFNNDYRIYFSPLNPDLMAWEKLLDTYSRSDGMSVVIGAKDGKEKIFSPEVMPKIVEITHDLWLMPYVTRVDSVSNFQEITSKGDDINVSDLVPKDKATEAGYLQKKEQVALAEPTIQDVMLSKDGTVTSINLQMMIPASDENAISKATANMLDFKAKIESKYPDLTVHLGGLVMLNGAFDYFARSDMATIMPVMFLITTIVMILVFRSVLATVAALLTVMATVLITMGITGYLGIPIGPHSSVSPQIVKTISVATVIYVVLAFLRQIQIRGDRDDAVKEAVKANIIPIGLSSLTAIIGFLSMLTSVIPPFRHIGIMCGLGTFISYILSLTFLPSLFLQYPSRFLRGAGEKVSWQWPTKLGNFIVRNYKVILVVMFLAPAPAIMGFFKLDIDDNFVRLFRVGTWFRDSADYIDKHLAGATAVYFNLQSGKSEGINDPDFIRQVDDVKKHLEQDPVVTHVSVITDTMRKINQEMHGGDPAFYTIPQEKTAVAQNLMFYEMNLPFGLELNSQLSTNKSAIKLTAVTKSLSTKDTIAFVERTNAWLKEKHPSLNASAVSVLVMFSYMAHDVAVNAYTAAAIAIALIVLVILIGFRDIRLSFIAIFSNLIPIMIVLGLWHWAGRTLDFTAGLIFSMTFGVIVDNSLHIMYWYSRAMRFENLSVQQSVISAIERRGASMLFSTVTLVLGFSIFGLSNFFVNVTLGLLTATVFLLGLIWDILVTPSFLMLLKPYAGGRNARS